MKTIQQGVPIAKIELLDAQMMQAINRYASLDYQETPTLFLEFHGSVLEIEAQVAKVQQYAHQFGALDFVWEKEEERRQKLWQARIDAAPAALALRPGAQLMSTDVCVPISKLAQCIGDTQIDIQQTGILAPILGHVGDGNFHLTILVHPEDPDAFTRAKALNERLVHRALALGGTCTGEHGIGVGKLGFMDLEHHGAVEVMRAIKRALDPSNLMNPGKLLPPL
ncbi:MAG: FAD-linked oxidase C-terminal domain-containing protein [Spirosomataceae bacterium]